MRVAAGPIAATDFGQEQPLRVTAGACSIQGARRDRNEDRAYISPAFDLFIVADGMGGHTGGEVASQFAIDVLSRDLTYLPVDATSQQIGHRVRTALHRVHCSILNAAAAKPEYHGAGAAVVLALLLDGRLSIASVGDSRAYRIRRREIGRLTIDDTWPETLLSLGRLSVAEARRHGMRHVLLSALGIEGFNANQEEVQTLAVCGGDRYLLASDGLTDAVEEDRLVEIVCGNDNPGRAAELLTQEASANGAGDDVTCVVFYMEGALPAKVLSPAIPMARRSIWSRLPLVFHRGEIDAG